MNMPRLIKLLDIKSCKYGNKCKIITIFLIPAFADKNSSPTK